MRYTSSHEMKILSCEERLHANLALAASDGSARGRPPHLTETAPRSPAHTPGTAATQRV